MARRPCAFAVPVASSLVSTVGGTLYAFARLGTAEPAGPRLIGEGLLVAALCAVVLTVASEALSLGHRRDSAK
jgi:predicted ABC-type sugar transport system permease subunit